MRRQKVGKGTLLRQMIVVAGLSLLAACIGGGGGPAAVRQFVLDYPAPAARSAPCSPDAVKVLEFTTARGYNSTSMVYSVAPLRREPYLYSRWRVMPGEMVSDYLVRDLRKAMAFGAVFSQRDGEVGRFVVEGMVDEFFENDEGSGPQAVMALTVTLLDTRHQDLTKRLIFQKGYRAQEPMGQKNADALAAAMSRTAARLSQEVIGDVCQAVAGR